MPRAVPLVPIVINPDNWPPAVKRHFFQRVRERGLKAHDLIQVRQWAAQHPHSRPGEEWYKVFPTFTIVGQGRYPKSVLTPGMHPKGRKLALKSKLLQPIEP
jgi:hypothetical protein